MAKIHHRFADVRGQRLFYREAGPADAPTLVLLHGFPASSFMFRNLLPLLADRWHLVAPDHLGFGHSDAPPVTRFTYTFDALAALTRDLLGQLGIERYAMYVQDHGAPIGWRLALHDPTAVTAIISQNGNAYPEGFVPEFFDTVRYATNPPLYPVLHRYFRAYQVPLLAVWGRDDPVFGPDGARAFANDLPAAEIHLLDGGHFLLESALDETVPLIRAFLSAHL